MGFLTPQDGPEHPTAQTNGLLSPCSGWPQDAHGVALASRLILGLLHNEGPDSVGNFGHRTQRFQPRAAGGVRGGRRAFLIRRDWVRPLASAWRAAVKQLLNKGAATRPPILRLFRQRFRDDVAFWFRQEAQVR